MKLKILLAITCLGMFSCSSSSDDNKNAVNGIVLPKAVAEHDAKNCPDISGVIYNEIEIYDEKGNPKGKELLKGEILSLVVENGIQINETMDINRKDEVVKRTVDGKVHSEGDVSLVGYCTANKTIELVGYKASKMIAQLSYSLDEKGNLEETLKCFDKEICKEEYIKTHNR